MHASVDSRQSSLVGSNTNGFIMARVLLSIVIPTLNRAPLLEATLRLAAESIQRVGASVELLVCDNASEDNTRKVVEHLVRDFPSIGYHYFAERVSIDQSFKRSVDACRGEYIWILGDDDFPFSGSIKRLTDAIQSYPECRFFHFERLTADPKMRRGNFSFEIADFGDELMTGREMIKRVLFRPGFISSFMAHRSLWQGMFDLRPYAGYGFLAWIYTRIFEEQVLLIGEPLCVQRISKALWKAEWPRYLLLSQPRIIQMLPFEEDEKKQVMDCWRRAYSNPRQFFYNALLARSNGFSSDPAWLEVLGYQRRLNQLISKIICFCPVSLGRQIVGKYLGSKHR